MNKRLFVILTFSTQLICSILSLSISNSLKNLRKMPDVTYLDSKVRKSLDGHIISGSR
jgi:hypothetical protein